MKRSIAVKTSTLKLPSVRREPLEPSHGETTGARWSSLYTIGGAVALTVVLLYLLDIIISFGGADTQPGALTAVEWFAVLEGNALLGLRTLGLLNVISVMLAVPLYVALYAAHRRVGRMYAALALIVYLLGAAVYISNNAAVPMFVLSGKYAAATTDVQRTLLAAAGEALLASGEDFTPGSFIGFFLTEIAAITISLVMLRGRVFSRTAAYTGLLGFALLSIFTIWATFVPVLYQVAILLALVGGFSSLAWYILVARRLFQLGRAS